MATEKRDTTDRELLKALRSSTDTICVQLERFRAQVRKVEELEDAAISAGRPPARPDYELGPILDIAAHLRKLLLAGRGDNLLRRCYTAVGLDEPELRVGSSVPEFDRPRWPRFVKSYFAAGCMPADVDDGTAQTLALAKALDEKCVVLADGTGRVVTYTWRGLIGEIANMGAVHVDETRPVAWDTIDEYYLGVVPGTAFCLFRMGLAVAGLANAALAGGGLDEIEHDPSPTVGAGLMIAAISATEYGRWSTDKPGRNELCVCGSGDKFKRCCGRP